MSERADFTEPCEPSSNKDVFEGAAVFFFFVSWFAMVIYLLVSAF